MTAVGKLWHPEHFACVHCGDSLSSCNFFERNFQPYCERDYYLIFSPKCESCTGPILDVSHYLCYIIFCILCQKQPVSEEWRYAAISVITPINPDDCVNNDGTVIVGYWRVTDCLAVMSWGLQQDQCSVHNHSTIFVCCTDNLLSAITPVTCVRFTNNLKSYLWAT